MSDTVTAGHTLAPAEGASTLGGTPPSARDRNAEGARAHRFTRRLTGALGVVVIALAAVFFVTTTSNLILILNEVQAVKDGPYPVSVAAGRIETLLVQLRTATADSAALNNPERASQLAEEFEAINIEMDSRIGYILDNSIADDMEGNALAVAYADMKERQKALVALCKDPAVGDDEVQAYVTDRIEPLIRGLLLIDIDLLETSTAVVDDTYATVGQAIRTVIIVSSILMGAVVVSVIFYMSIITRANRRQEGLREELEDALSRAQAASNAKSAFLANMSHDIRTPMNAIVGLVSIAQAHVDDPDRTKEYLNRITVSSKHLLSLINDILDMSKIESGKFRLNCTPFMLPEVTEKFLDIVAPQMRAKHLRFDVCIFDITHEALVGDTLRLSQVLFNLTSNAVKYTPEGGAVRVSITEMPNEKPGYARLAFEIEDTGIGMSPEFLDHVFDVFERERNETTNFIQGTGLGMAIVKNAVDMMDGTVTVASTPDVGSTFRVEIPLEIDEDAHDDAAPTVADGGLRLLFVDDNERVRENIRHIMDDWRIDADVVASGTEAVALAGQAQGEGRCYRAIVIDWIMPELDGISTTRQLKAALGDAMPPVILASYDMSNIQDRARTAGVSGFIAKPLFRTRLKQMICELQEGCPTEPTGVAAEEAPVAGHVLLVEDNEINLDIALELLDMMGDITTDCAKDGLQAVEMMEAAPEGTYDIVFMDWQMPRMDGIAATKAIIEHEKATGKRHTPIVAMTANAFNEDRATALDAGMDDFMTKPISVRLLREILQKYLG